MINVLATIKLKTGVRADFLQQFNDNVPAVLAEDGCLEYFPAVDVESGFDIQEKDENSVTVIEKWLSMEALHAHLAAPHMATYREQVQDLVHSVSLKVLEKRV